MKYWTSSPTYIYYWASVKLAALVSTCKMLCASQSHFNCKKWEQGFMQPIIYRVSMGFLNSIKSLLFSWGMHGMQMISKTYSPHLCEPVSENGITLGVKHSCSHVSDGMLKGCLKIARFENHPTPLKFFRAFVMWFIFRWRAYTHHSHLECVKCFFSPAYRHRLSLSGCHLVLGHCK